MPLIAFQLKGELGGRAERPMRVEEVEFPPESNLAAKKIVNSNQE